MDYYVDKIPLNMSVETRELLKDWAMFTLKWADWTCATRDFREYFDTHPSYLAGEIMFLICGILTLIHAIRNGARFVYLWIGLILHGLVVELLVYSTSNMDNYWHAQSFLMFFGRRQPIYIIVGLYPMFDYTASIAAKKLRLPWWAEGPAVGLFAVLLDVPYDIMGIKLLWWSWHDTDPNIYDRMYWVPWTSYYFHAAFGCAFTWMLKLARNVLLKEDEYDWKKFPREISAMLFAAFSAFWVGALQFIPIYDLFHYYFKVPTECCCMAFLAFFAFLVWIADRHPSKEARPRKGESNYWFDELPLCVLLHYFFFMGLVFLADPANIAATGMHEPIGPCDQWIDVKGVISGVNLTKKRYLCPTKYDEKYFDFHCLPDGKAPRPPKDSNSLDWYTICGTPYPNFAEYVFIIWTCCLLGLAVFYQIFSRAGELPLPKRVVYVRKRKEDKERKKNE